MNDVKADLSVSYETSPDLYLFTSLTAGSSHIITATSRMETILKANRIPFKAVDCATDEKARRIWGRRAAGKKLPGLVKEGQVLGDLEVVEEWNEFGEIKQMLGGGAAAAPKPAPPPAATGTAVDKAAPTAAPAAASKENVKPTENGPVEMTVKPAPGDSSTDASTESRPEPSTTIQADLPVRTKSVEKTPQQIHAQLGAEAAAIAQLHSKQQPKSILDREPHRKNSRLVTEDDVADAPAPAATASDNSTAVATEGSSAQESAPMPSHAAAAAADAPAAESTPSISFVEPEPRATAPPSLPQFPTTTTTELPAPTADTTTTTTTTTSTSSAEPTPPEPLPITLDPARAPRASTTAGDLAVSTSPPSSTLKRDTSSMSSDEDAGALPSFQPLDDAVSSGSAVVTSPTGSVAAVSVASGDVHPVMPVPMPQRHRGSSISNATEEEVRDAEARNRIVEEDEGVDAMPCV